MAKAWYPVVDYTLCTECGTCVSKCPHDVYDVEKAPTPIVVRPVDCVDHCHGCGNRCPVGAITYVGDDTGWVPPNGTPKEKDQDCSCGCTADSAKKVTVEYLYLDLETCDRCIGTDNVLDDVMMVLDPALKIAGFEVDYKKVEMKTAEIASQYQFLSSPTIRVNGADICQTVSENNCGCCGDISGTDVNCRVFEYNGQSYEVPPKEMLAEAVLSAVFGQAGDKCSCGEYKLPENLKVFYEGKQNKSVCSCGGNC